MGLGIWGGRFRAFKPHAFIQRQRLHLNRQYLACTSIHCLRIATLGRVTAFGGSSEMTNGTRIGTEIGVFRIDSLLGVGGMGEVYRAHDTKLDRGVAIKVLPPAFASDPDRLARFKREAQVLASLNHPNIGSIYGFEDDAGVHALVLELVEGPTLADTLELARASKGLPLDEALAIARQITDALEAAHEQGIIHRDLKPANIKVRDDGTVKVLDFGLAKLTQPDAAVQAGATQSPTITTPAMTAAGMILGTAAYMSPEQAKGKPADKRSDIWSFGCILYEMLTGVRPFRGDDVADTLAAVLRAEPDWSAVRNDVPLPIRRLLRDCLTKDRAKRLGHVAVARFVVSGATAIETSPSPARSIRAWTTLGISAVALLAGVAGAQLWRTNAPPTPADVGRFTIELPEQAGFTMVGRSIVAVSSDGRQIAYVAEDRLYVRPVGEFESRAIAGIAPGEGIHSPVFSPDGRALAYVSATENAIKRIPIEGGTPLKICDVVLPLGVSWFESDLFFGAGVNGIMRVSTNGGVPQRIAEVPDTELAYGPQMLPGGKGVLFSAIRRVSTGVSAANSSIILQPLPSGPRKTLVVDGAVVRYVPSGYLLFAQGGLVVARPFSAERVEFTGAPVPVLQGVRRGAGASQALTQFAVSDTGTVAYIPGPVSVSTLTRSLVVASREGLVTPLPPPPARYVHPRVSSDSQWIALEKDEDAGSDIYLYRLDGSSAMQRLTLDRSSRFPIWSPRNQVTYQSERDGDVSIWSQDIGGAPVRLTKAAKGFEHAPEAWSPDGRTLLFSQRSLSSAGPAFSLWTLTDGKAETFADVRSAETFSASFSPDAHWVAYAQTNEAGGTVLNDRGVFIRRFPADASLYALPKERIDFHPLWAPNGREILFVPNAGRLVSISVRTDPVPSFGPPVSLSAAAAPDRLSVNTRDWDIMKDGRFLAAVPASGSATTLPRELRVVTNWFEELKRLIPKTPE